jgi:UDP-N-acetylglucosamine--N-acetylmuramyl-(pentapeptide) pyrophosphoryl-undecaprenol N-acetylglucosamine transferase
MRILFTGGGTGGHVFPLVAVVREMRRICPESERKKLKFFYLGPRDPFASIFLSHEGVEIKEIMTGKIRRYLHWKNILENIFDIFFKVPIGIIQAFFYIFTLAPDAIFSKGGYGSIPAVISGWLLWVPIFLHESDSTPGLANRFLSKFSSKIFISFPETQYFSPKKIIWSGNPIRKEILHGTKEEAKNLFKLTLQKPIILVLGGSQGAQRINDLNKSEPKQMLLYRKNSSNITT